MKKRFLLLLPIMGLTLLALWGYDYYHKKEISPFISALTPERISSITVSEDTAPPKTYSVQRDTTFKAIRGFYEPREHYMEFWEQKATQPTMVIKLADANPFGKLPYPVAESNASHILYDLSGVSLDELAPYFGGTLPPIPPLPHEELGEEHEDHSPASAWSSVISSAGRPLVQGHAAVNYSLSVYGKHEEALASTSRIVVYNEKGEVASSFQTSSLGKGMPVVTWNGKYVAGRYGGLSGECGDHYEQEGVQIMDAATGKVVLSYPMTIHNPYLFAAHGYIVFINSYGKEGILGNLTDFFIFDMDNNRIWKKTWPLKNRPNLAVAKDFMPDHLVYYTDDAQSVSAKAYFSTDFEDLGNIIK